MASQVYRQQWLNHLEETFARHNCRCRVPAAADDGDQRQPRDWPEVDVSTNRRRRAVHVTGGTGRRGFRAVTSSWRHGAGQVRWLDRASNAAEVDADWTKMTSQLLQ